MKINEKTLFAFANSKPVDKEGYLSKRGEGSTNIKFLLGLFRLSLGIGIVTIIAM